MFNDKKMAVILFSNFSWYFHENNPTFFALTLVSIIILPLNYRSVTVSARGEITVQMEHLAGSIIIIKMTPTFVVSVRVPVFTQHHEVNERS